MQTSAVRRRRDSADPPRIARSAGSVALQRMSERQVDIADRIQVDRTLVARWGTGDRSPTPAQRKLLRACCGIPIAAWGKPAEAAPVLPSSVDEESLPLSATSFRAETQKLFDETVRLRRRAEAFRESNNDKMYIKFLREAAVQQTLLGRLLGVTSQISEERMLRVPAFRSLIDRVLRAVAPFPEALRAIIETLEILEEDSRPRVTE